VSSKEDASRDESPSEHKVHSGITRALIPTPCHRHLLCLATESLCRRWVFGARDLGSSEHCVPLLMVDCVDQKICVCQKWVNIKALQHISCLSPSPSLDHEAALTRHMTVSSAKLQSGARTFHTLHSSSPVQLSLLFLSFYRSNNNIIIITSPPRESLHHSAFSPVGLLLPLRARLPPPDFAAGGPLARSAAMPAASESRVNLYLPLLRSLATVSASAPAIFTGIFHTSGTSASRRMN
jgi:hypothetical protein